MLLTTEAKGRPNRSKPKVEVTKRDAEVLASGVCSAMQQCKSPFSLDPVSIREVVRACSVVLLLFLYPCSFGNSIPIFLGESPTPHFYKAWREVLAFLEGGQGSLAQPIRALHFLCHSDGFRDGHLQMRVNLC